MQIYSFLKTQRYVEFLKHRYIPLMANSECARYFLFQKKKKKAKIKVIPKIGIV